jgi:hypothetical protein
MSGMTELTAGEKNAPQIPIPTVSTAVPRMASIQIMSKRRSNRSTTTPATGETRMRGSVDAAMRPPMSAVDPVTARIQNPSAIA